VCNNFTKNSAGNEIPQDAVSDDDGLADLEISSASTIDLTIDEEINLDLVESKFSFKIIIVKN
jgi:hypothetical protein